MAITNDLAITLFKKTESENDNINSITYKSGAVYTDVKLESVSQCQMPQNYINISKKSYEIY